MKRSYLLVALAFFVGTQSLVAQSQLSRQLQQQLKSRKSTTSTKNTASPANDEAPTKDTAAASAKFRAKSPQEFCDSLHLAVLSKNLDAFNGLISWNTILSSATNQLQGKSIDEFKANFQQDVKSTNSMGAKIINSVSSGGTYEFLQLRKNEKTVVAVFRMLLPSGKGVNYHEYALAKTKAGDVIASDIYIYLTGENLSQSIRRNLITAVIDQKEKPQLALSGKDKLLADNIAVIKELNTALSKNDASTAREQILKLPIELRNDKAIQTLTLNTYKNSSAFATVLAGVRKSNPRDVFMDMLSIDILIRQKKYADAITSIQRIDQRVGGDPYLKILHGRMLLNQGKQDEGRQLIREAVSEDDGILTGYWNLVSFALKDQDHETTLDLLKKIHLRFKIKFKDLREIPSYKEFVKSPEFSEWTKYIESSNVSAPQEDLKTSQSKSDSPRRTASQSTTKAK